MKQTAKNKKAVLISLLIVLVILIISVVGISVAGILKGANTDDGMVAFAKDTVRVVFLGEEKEQYISAESLLLDLENNGFTDILFPEEFSYNLDKYKFTVPRYSNTGIEQVSFDITFNESLCGFTITKEELAQQELEFVGLENAETMTINDVNFYIFDFGNLISVKFEHNGFCYDISSSCLYEDMIKIIESIK